MSSTPHRTDFQNLFTSAFRREDIRNKLASNSHCRSSSYTFSRKHGETEVLESQDFQDTRKLSETFEVSRSKPATFSEPFSKHYAKDDFEYNNDMKYQDMAKRYERMQEFYKTQVSRLTEEVNHYKTLYHKLLIQYSSERKSLRGLKPLTTRFYTLFKFVVLPVSFYQVLSRCEEFEEQGIVALADLVLSQLKKELSQPNAIQAGHRSLQITLIRNLYQSSSNSLSVSKYVSRLLDHSDVRNFGKSTVNNLLNKLWMKKLILDTIDGYKKHYRIKEISPNSLNSQ